MTLRPRLDSILLTLVVLIYVWAAWDMSETAREHEETRAYLETLVARKVDPSDAFYGPRKGWFYDLPCCVTLHPWYGD